MSAEEPPIVITDKRNQKKEAVPSVVQPDPEVGATDPGEETPSSERQARMRELVDKGREHPLDPEESAELLRLQAQEQGSSSPDMVPGMTAFVVIVGHNGDVIATPDVNVLMDLERQANTNDMYGACSILLRDISTSQTSMGVIARMQGAMQQVAARGPGPQATIDRALGKHR